MKRRARTTKTAARTVCAWLGIFAIVLQTLLLPVLAFEIHIATGTLQTVVICAHDGPVTAIISADPNATEQDSSGHQSEHKSCPVCGFLHAAKILVAPAAIALFGPLDSSQILQITEASNALRTISIPPYESRAPPQIG